MAVVCCMQAMDTDELRKLLKDYLYNDRILYGSNVMMAIASAALNGMFGLYPNYDISARFAEANVAENDCQRVTQMCEQMRQTFKKRIAASTWLSEGSKARALEKLDAMNMFVGKPSEFFSEGIPDLTKGQTLTEDVIELRRAFFALQRRIVGMTVAQGEFHVNCSTLGSLTDPNAFYETSSNSIFILPVWLMSPVYDPAANSALNFGQICWAIGHEMTHGFDTTGCLFDKLGDPGSLWVSEAFEEKAKQLIDWYSGFEVLPGVQAKGEVTITEDIADLGSLEIGFQTYTEYLTANGFSGEQLRLQQRRFYEAYGYLWRVKYTENYITQFIASGDPHSLFNLRVNGVVTNTAAWYDLFGIKPSDKLYRDPEDRVHIW